MGIGDCLDDAVRIDAQLAEAILPRRHYVNGEDFGALALSIRKLGYILTISDPKELDTFN
jgi:hypothetical protein